MKTQQHITQILQTLDAHYPKEVICYLNHETPFQLLIATILSAQCTDDRVNIVTQDLFKQYPDANAFAAETLENLEKAVKSTGFYKNKAKNIKQCAMTVAETYHGEVPQDIESLTALAGVGRKTANVVRGNIYKIPSIVVDTHVKRISIRWGLTLATDPVAIEMDLMKQLPEAHWIRYNTQVIAHGRAICTARSPKCDQCMFLALCPYGLRNRLEQLPDTVQDAIQKGHMY